MVGVEPQGHAFGSEVGPQAHVYAFLALGVEEGEFYSGALVEEVRLQPCLEGVRVCLSLVAHIAFDLYARTVLEDAGVYGVELQLAQFQPAHVAPA